MYIFPQISTNRKIAIYLFLLAIVLGPYLTLAFFCHPLPGDDFTFALRTLQLGSHGDVVYEAYVKWTGRYFLCWVLTWRSIFYNTIFGYQLCIFILILAFPVLIHFLVKFIFKTIDLGHHILLVLIITFLYLYNLPSQSQGIFWFTGSIAYQFPNLMMGVYVIILYLITSSRSKAAISLYLLIGSVQIIMVSGCNEISMGILFVFNVLCTGYQFYNKSDKRYVFLFLISISLMASVVVCMAPGNDLRETLFPDKHKILVTIFMSFLGAGYYIGQWIFMTLLLTILFIPLIKKYTENIRPFFKLPLPVAFVSWLLLLAVAFIVPAWATGQMPNARAINIIFYLFVLGWFYNLIILVDYLKNKGYEIPVTQRAVTFLLVMSIIFVTFNPSPFVNNNVKYTYKDLITGKAERYRKLMIQYREDVRKSPVPIYADLSDMPNSFTPTVEWDTVEVTEIHTYYKLKDQKFGNNPF